MNQSLTQMPVRDKQANARDFWIPDKPKREKRLSRNLALVITLDMLFLNLCFWCPFLLQIPQEKLAGHLLTKDLLIFGVTINILWLLIVPFTDVYRIFEGIKLELKVKNLFSYTLIYCALVSIIYYNLYFEIFKVNFLWISFGLFFLLTATAHGLIRYYYQKKSLGLSYAIVGGANSNVNYLRNVLSSIYGEKANCVGRFAHDDSIGVKHLGTFQDIEEYILNDSKINKLLYFYSDLPKSAVKRLIQLCRSRFIDFEIVPQGIDFFERGIQIEQLANLPIFRRKKEPLCQAPNQILKRGFDIAFSLFAIVFIFSWLFPIVALLIRLDSKGPIFFLQKRTGYWNKPFNCIKFRTMLVNNQSDQIQATKSDDRITGIGAILRKYNIDELPQFFNVLMGDMSVVGPRPHMIKHTLDFSKLIDVYNIRHEVKPGITGWAQVNGWRGPTDQLYKMAKRVEFDVNYIENWSFWFDCKCVFLTVVNMVKGEDNAF